MATKHKKAAAKSDPYLTRAQLAASLKFDPQMSALVQLAVQAAQRRDYGVKLAKGTGQATQALIDQQAPKVRQGYLDAGTVPNAPAAQLPAGTVDFATAGNFESQAAQHRMSQSMNDAIAGLAAARVQAQSGATFGAQQAQSQYADDVGKIAQQESDLSGQKGTFTAKTLLDLVDAGNKTRDQDRRAAAALAQSDLNNRRSTHQSDVNSRRTAASKGGTAGKLATPTQHGAFSDAVGSAQAQVQDLLSSGYTPAEIRKDLIEGVPATTTTNSKGEKVRIPAVPKFKPLVASVAIELSTGAKALSAHSVRELHHRRLSVKRLGYPTLAKAPKKVAKGISTTPGVTTHLFG